jgi:hypothetical protein
MKHQREHEREGEGEGEKELIPILKNTDSMTCYSYGSYLPRY